MIWLLDSFVPFVVQEVIRIFFRMSRRDGLTTFRFFEILNIPNMFVRVSRCIGMVDSLFSFDPSMALWKNDRRGHQAIIVNIVIVDVNVKYLFVVF